MLKNGIYFNCQHFQWFSTPPPLTMSTPPTYSKVKSWIRHCALIQKSNNILFIVRDADMGYHEFARHPKFLNNSLNIVFMIYTIKLIAFCKIIDSKLFWLCATNLYRKKWCPSGKERSPNLLTAITSRVATLISASSKDHVTIEYHVMCLVFCNY